MDFAQLSREFTGDTGCSIHPMTLGVYDGSSFPIEWLATANIQTPKQIYKVFLFIYFFHSFHVGDVIYNPFFSNLLFQIISHFINWYLF